VYLVALFSKKCPANSDDGSRQAGYFRMHDNIYWGNEREGEISVASSLTNGGMRATRHNVVTSQGINFSMENGLVCQGTAVWCAKLVCRAGSSMDRPLRREARRRFFCTDNSGLCLCTHKLNHLAKNTAKNSCLAAPCPPNGHRGGSWCVKLCQKTRVSKLAPVQLHMGRAKFLRRRTRFEFFVARFATPRRQGQGTAGTCTIPGKKNGDVSILSAISPRDKERVLHHAESRGSMHLSFELNDSTHLGLCSANSTERRAPLVQRRSWYRINLM